MASAGSQHGEEKGQCRMPQEQIEGCGAAAQCLETKGNWRVAISAEWLFTALSLQIRAGAHTTLSLSSGGTKPKEGGQGRISWFLF